MSTAKTKTVTERELNKAATQFVKEIVTPVPQPHESCSNCRFAKSEGGLMVFCHRFPPQCMDTHGIVIDKFPHMERANWCGEWKAK